MSLLDFPVLVSLAGDAVDQHVLTALTAAGFAGLNPRHGYVVQRLLDTPATATEMAADLGVTQQAVAKTVAELVALGYVETTVDDADRRRRPVVLTARGHECVVLARRTRANLQRRLRRRVTTEALDAATAVVVELLGVLGLDDRVASRTVPMPRQPD